MGERLLKCSTSTDVEATTEPSQNEPDDLEQQVFPKKQKKVEEYTCIFENKSAYGHSYRSILVQGLDCSLPVADIRSALRKHFGSCGHILSVFVPTECKTGSLLGCALIKYYHPNDEKKALALDGSFLGGMQLGVVKNNTGSSSDFFPNFKGCERCVLTQRKYLHDQFIATRGGRMMAKPPNWILAKWGLALTEEVEAEKQS
ncbi:RNA-binding domain superfamily [Arabidopsis thaliana x Arabidopsis arenosa]|uniref:RNA-binding domain superfamily n=1 Tax=Arabidopsis thaliana x Arabidopsis arenosa TaxID=1240361 RepID=A0A8T1XU68_9BRAS|nr:RNA-binding domain superfamily [Arabidopsis thaliana x Arabidopsis arenosa]